jgi:hypothetical protein
VGDGDPAQDIWIRVDTTMTLHEKTLEVWAAGTGRNPTYRANPPDSAGGVREQRIGRTREKVKPDKGPVDSQKPTDRG